LLDGVVASPEMGFCQLLAGCFGWGLTSQGRGDLQGGPFAYEKDGSVFGNREQLLPAHKRGYYREYTVPTPGAKNRGKRRIVCGGQAKAPDVCYYTADHYASFRKIGP
jgi:ribonuclease T1